MTAGPGRSPWRFSNLSPTNARVSASLVSTGIISEPTWLAKLSYTVAQLVDGVAHLAGVLDVLVVDDLAFADLIHRLADRESALLDQFGDLRPALAEDLGAGGGALAGVGDLVERGGDRRGTSR